MPKISVIVPLYNEERFVTDTIHCLRAQTFTEFECVVVDDCSTDNSVAVATKAIDGDSRFRIIRNKVNSKLSATRNIGLLYASGDYIVFLDSDDILAPTTLQERYHVASLYPFNYIAGSYSKHTSIPEDTQIYNPSSKLKHPDVNFFNTFGDCPFVVHSPMTRRDVACGVCGFSEDLKHGAEDFDFWLRILRHGFVFLPTNSLNAFYRSKTSSMVRDGAHHHLDAALNIFTRNHTEISRNDFFDIAALKMYLPLNDYIKENQYFDRIFRFLGMQLTLDVRHNDTLIDYAKIASYLPNFHQNFPYSLSAYELLTIGIQRKNPDQVSNPQFFKEYDAAIIDCIQKIAKTTRKNEQEKLENLNEEVELYSAEWQRQVDIAFLPHKDYHTVTILHMEQALKNAGLSFVVVDSSAIYKDEGVRSVLENCDLPHISLPQLCFGDFSPKCVIAFNDWDRTVTRPAMQAAKDANIIAMSIVEGVQDYDDADTGRVRNAYKTCSHVITPCKFDMKYFDPTKQKVFEGSIPRIANLFQEASNHPYNIQGEIVINSNFSYNVLTDKRDAWVRESVEACQELEREYAISVHPADLGDFSKYNVTQDTMYNAIWNGSLFISRFGSGIIEALAMGRPVIYYNPHDEQIDKFKDPMGAYYIANSKEELKDLIIKTYENLSELKKHWAAFLAEHAGFNVNAPEKCNQMVVDILTHVIQSTELPSQKDRKKFGTLFAKNFQVDDATLFNNVKFLKDWNK